MGGELRPEIQHEIFSDDYPAGTEYHQNFTTCVDVTHATYMLNYYAFKKENSYQGVELDRALKEHVKMGYSFMVTLVEVSESNSNDNVDVSVTVQQLV